MPKPLTGTPPANAPNPFFHPFNLQPDRYKFHTCFGRVSLTEPPHFLGNPSNQRFQRPFPTRVTCQGLPRSSSKSRRAIRFHLPCGCGMKPSNTPCKQVARLIPYPSQMVGLWVGVRNGRGFKVYDPRPIGGLVISNGLLPQHAEASDSCVWKCSGPTTPLYRVEGGVRRI